MVLTGSGFDKSGDLLIVNVKTMRTIAQIFVAFSEKLRFKETEENFFVVMDRSKPRTSYLLDSKVQLF